MARRPHTHEDRKYSQQGQTDEQMDQIGPSFPLQNTMTDEEFEKKTEVRTLPHSMKLNKSLISARM